MRRLVISPHPDDAVWSCGGVLGRWADRGDQITVVTVFDGDPPAQIPASTTAAARRREDAEALATWPVQRLSLGLPEATHRGGGGCYPGLMSRRRGIHPADRQTVDVVAASIVPLLASADAVLVPLAIRTHVDHVIVRAATEGAVGHSGHRPNLTYYQEFPYLPAPGATGRLMVRTYPADFGQWLRTGLRYRSQVSAMFGGALGFARALARHARAGDGSWVWREWTVQSVGSFHARP
ncbi:MAG: PIG-L family deacetylase [Pseudonocardiaceae bacterium]